MPVRRPVTPSSLTGTVGMRPDPKHLLGVTCAACQSSRIIDDTIGGVSFLIGGTVGGAHRFICGSIVDVSDLMGRVADGNRGGGALFGRVGHFDNPGSHQVLETFGDPRPLGLSG